MRREIRDLGAGVSLLTGETLRGNTLVVRDGRRALLVDAMSGTDDARWLADWLRGEGLTVAAIVATHYFSDHMAALTLFPEATIFAHRRCDETFAAEVNRSAEESGFYAAPTVLVEDGVLLRFGGLELDVFHNPGYTPDMLNVDIPALDLAHAGDTVVGSMVFLAYADLPRLRTALTRLKRLGRRRLVASHGGVADPETIGEAEAYLERLLEDPGRTLEECLTGGVSGEVERYYHARNQATLKTKDGATSVVKT